MMLLNQMKYLMRAEMETKTVLPEIYPLWKTFTTAMNDFLLNKSYGSYINVHALLRIYIVGEWVFISL
jgi:hypothetical protein